MGAPFVLWSYFKDEALNSTDGITPKTRGKEIVEIGSIVMRVSFAHGIRLQSFGTENPMFAGRDGELPSGMGRVNGTVQTRSATPGAVSLFSVVAGNACVKHCRRFV